MKTWDSVDHFIDFLQHLKRIEIPPVRCSYCCRSPSSFFRDFSSEHSSSSSSSDDYIILFLLKDIFSSSEVRKCYFLGHSMLPVRPVVHDGRGHWHPGAWEDDSHPNDLGHRSSARSERPRDRATGDVVFSGHFGVFFGVF